MIEFLRMFPDDETAEQWFVETRWPDGIDCPRCHSDNVQPKTKHATMPFRCRSCRRFFSVKTETVMQASNIGYQKWVVAGLDRQARHLGVTRQALIKLWIAERLPKSPTEGTRLSGWRQVAIALLQATEWIPPGSAGFRI